MKTLAACRDKFISVVLLTIVFAGCDQMEKVASGVGSASRSVSDKVSKGIINRNSSDSEDAVDSDSAADSAAEAPSGDDEEIAETSAEAADKPDEPDEPDEADEPESADDSDESDAAEESVADGRNVEQYARLPRNVTWKPVSSSSGDKLTIVLWGKGGGERDYEEGSLRIEHNDGVTYPRTYVRWDDPDNGERAPKFYFDVEGGWFVGKDPVLFWNLGAYRVVSPEKRQGKNEE